MINYEIQEFPRPFFQLTKDITNFNISDNYKQNTCKFVYYHCY